MYLSELSDGGVSDGNRHVSSWDERRAAASFECIIKMQVVAERIEQGMGIIERVVGSDKQYTHFPARVRNSLLIQEQGFGEQVKCRGRMRRRGVYSVSQQWRQAAINGIFTIFVDSIDEMNESLWRIMAHAIDKVLV